jgi:hypothetical protein
MPSARLAILSALISAPILLATVACDAPKPAANCGLVDGHPHSDVGAGEIQAHGANCTVARNLADQVYRHAKGKPYNYSVWRCTGGIPSHGLGDFVWCNGPQGSVVTWRSV